MDFELPEELKLVKQTLRRYVEARGWTAMEYVDAGISGAKDRRPALDQLMTDARQRRLEYIHLGAAPDEVRKTAGSGDVETRARRADAGDAARGVAGHPRRKVRCTISITTAPSRSPTRRLR